MQNDEKSLRVKLGISLDAEHVLIFTESSHWDPNWLYTSEEYYRRFVKDNLDLAIEELEKEPRRIYSIECMFFLRMYWERCPHQRSRIRQLVNERRIRLTSSGVTTADTLIPRTESILREFLLGQEWLRRNGMTQEPKLAYFTDCFGASPALPSLLNAAGFHQSAITRIDGMYFRGTDYELPRNFPRPGSNAERLLKVERTLDFVWRDRAGSELLCHWNAFTYGQGDMLAFRGFSRAYVFPVAFSARSERHIARRIRQFTEQLHPYRRTPYMLCPIGFDFVGPIHDLIALLDRYNHNQFPSTGFWIVNAGLDDYLDLVNCHRSELPAIEFDPNPYWTGFYTSRPALKQRCHDLVEKLLTIEKLTLLPENNKIAASISKMLEPAWWTAAVANHHDFITGTSPDRVVNQEQIPWLESASALSNSAIEKLSFPVSNDDPSNHRQELPQWNAHDGMIEVKTHFYAIKLAEEAGGAIIQAYHPLTHAPFLSGISNDLISYHESGGLWRMGYEFRGGRWEEEDHASKHPAHFQHREYRGGLEVAWHTEFRGERIERLIWFCMNSPLIRFRVIGRAPRRRCITVRFSTDLSCDQLMMDTPGGMIARPPQKLFQPTFWPFQNYVHIQEKGRGLAIFQALPGAISYRPNGELEIVALRNAPYERAFGFLPIPGNRAKGTEKDSFNFNYALLFTDADVWREGRITTMAYTLDGKPWENPKVGPYYEIVSSLLRVDRPDVWILASKPASRGEGWIVRLFTLTAVGERISLEVIPYTLKAAYLCDVRERDLETLEVRQGRLHMTMIGTIASLRLFFESA